MIATHGFSETSDYWTVGGFADLAARDLRLIPMDMRGHGRTRVQADVRGFDAETTAADIFALVAHLGLKSYDILAHATGSVVALRHAMGNPPGLRRMVLTSAASATAMAEPEFFTRMSAFYARRDWPDIFPRLRRSPEPFLNGLDRAVDPDRLWRAIEHVFAQCEPGQLSRFALDFYDDPDPRLAALRGIKADCLVISAELDEMMLEPSDLIVNHVPKATHVHLRGVGHMTAIECPRELADLVVRFLTR